MASGEQLKALLRSHALGDDDHFYAVALQLAAHEARRGHGKLAQELRDLVDEARARPPGTRGAKLVSLAQPRGELAALFSVSYPKVRLSDMVLE